MAISKRRAEIGEEKWAEYQKARRVKKVTNWRRRTKWKLVLYKGGKCQRCGYDKAIPAVYDFHHRDSSEKEFGLAKEGRCRGFETLKKEVDKCDLLCKNCHAEVHDAQDYNQ